MCCGYPFPKIGTFLKGFVSSEFDEKPLKSAPAFQAFPVLGLCLGAHQHTHGDRLLRDGKSLERLDAAVPSCFSNVQYVRNHGHCA